MPSVLDAVNTFRRQLLAGDRKAAKRLVKSYGVVWRRLRKNIDKLTDQIEQARAAGKDISPAWLMRQNRYQALLAQVEFEIARFAKLAERVITDEQRAAVLAARDAAKDMTLAAAKTAHVTVTFNKLPKAAVENMVGMLGSGAPLSDLLQTLPRLARQQVANALIVGVATGRNPRSIASDLRRALSGNLNRAKLIARTETLRAARLANLESFQKNDDVVRAWRWTASLSPRTCIACIALDGQIFPLTKPLPAHPACRCQMMPLLIDAPDPNIQTGAEWFDQQPAETKRAMMGKKAFDLYDDGIIDLTDFIGRRFHPAWGETTYKRSLLQILNMPRAAGF